MKKKIKTQLLHSLNIPLRLSTLRFLALISNLTALLYCMYEMEMFNPWYQNPILISCFLLKRSLHNSPEKWLHNPSNRSKQIL